MNLLQFISMKKSIFILLLSTINIRYSHGSCANLFDACNADCDCCNYNVNKNIRCELRNQGLGKRCYESKPFGQPCVINSQCNSQNCVNNVCQPQPILHIPPANPIPFCPLLSDPSNIVAIVDGSPPTCSCPKGPTLDASYAMDNNLSTDYVNYNSQEFSGFVVQPSFNAPLKKMEVCTSSASPHNDPMCYRIEGRCEDENDFILLQEGSIPFGFTRQNCVVIPFHSRISYTHYKIMFGCRRGGYDESCQNSSRNYNLMRRNEVRSLSLPACDDFPVMLSEVKLSGKCNQGLQKPTTLEPTDSPTTGCGQYNYVATDKYCKGGPNNIVGSSNDPIKFNKCRQRCDGRDGCNYFLYQNEPGANKRFACILYKACDTLKAYKDGDTAKLCMKPPTSTSEPTNIPTIAPTTLEPSSPEPTPTQNCGEYNYVATDKYCSGGNIDNDSSNDKIKFIQCKNRCDGHDKCNYFLYKNEPGTSRRYHCILYNTCDSLKGYNDGDTAKLCMKPPTSI